MEQHCRRFGSYARLSSFMLPLPRMKHTSYRLQNGTKMANKVYVNVGLCQQRHWSPCAAAAVSAAAEQQPKAASVEYQVRRARTDVVRRDIVQNAVFIY